MSEKICISDMTLDRLTAYIVGLGQPKFRAKQIFKWLHQKLVTEFAQMTDQPKTLLSALAEQCTIAAPSIRRRQQSRDGTVKYILELADGNCIETVLMRYKYGNTVCVSTQVGCAMGCRFCASTQAGRVRDLTAGEIASEIYTAQKDSGERVSHIVLMGIGEPLHNFDNVMDFLEIISCPEGVNIGMRNISLSTCGLVPKIDELANHMHTASLCALGQTAPNPVLSTMKYFRDEYIAHIRDKTCPAGVCKALIRYAIDPDKCKGCTKCARNCPAGAITGELKKPHHIDPEKCIKCGACKAGCPFGAIKEA